MGIQRLIAAVAVAAAALSMGSAGFSTTRSINDQLVLDASVGTAADVQRDLAAGANIEAVDDHGRTALIAAASLSNKVDIVRLLLDHGAKIDAKDKDGETALAGAADDHNVEIVRLLLAHGADRQPLDERLLRDASDGWADKIQADLAAGADANARAKDEFGYTALIEAATSFGDHKSDAVRVLLDHGADVNGRDNDGRTALIHQADGVGRDDPETVRLLLEYGADIDAKDKDGHTVMEWARMNMKENLANLILAHGVSNPGRQFVDDARAGEVDAVKSELAHGADVNGRDANGRTALMYAATYSPELTGILLDRGADVNATDNDGKTALVIATESIYSNVEAIKLLLTRGADPTIKDKEGKSALDFAYLRGNELGDLIYAHIKRATPSVAAQSTGTGWFPAWATGKWGGPGRYLTYEDVEVDKDSLISGPYADEDTCHRDAISLNQRLSEDEWGAFFCEDVANQTAYSELTDKVRDDLARMLAGSPPQPSPSGAESADSRDSGSFTLTPASSPRWEYVGVTVGQNYKFYLDPGSVGGDAETRYATYKEEHPDGAASVIRAKISCERWTDELLAHTDYNPDGSVKVTSDFALKENNIPGGSAFEGVAKRVCR